MLCKLNIVLYQPQMKTKNITKTAKAPTSSAGQKDLVSTEKSWQMVIAAMKLKDAYSLEGKLWPT